jgi:uncharacterized membrane protein YGL010W
LSLDQDWKRRVADFRRLHQTPANQLCHKLGVPMVVASIPLGLTVVGLPAALPLFALGYGLNFTGHYLEGNRPAFVERIARREAGHWRNVFVAVVWLLDEAGLVDWPATTLDRTA